MRDTFPVIVHTLLLRHDAVLLLRRARTGYRDGWYALPGGHLERGETIVACAIRECAEEVGIALDAAQIEPVAAMPYRSDGQQGVDFILACRDFVGEPRLAEPERFDAIGFFPGDALPAQTVPYVALALELRRRGEWFFEFVD